MWADTYATVCARQADLVAVHESPHGRMALLLRQTPMPLAEERSAWLLETRRAARGILAALRGTGFAGGVLVLQWLPLEEVARILSDWPCRYVGDRGRQASLSRLIERYLEDRRFLASHVADRRAPELAAEESLASLARLGDARQALGCWYRAVAPHWLAIEPVLRRRLVLETHRWVAAHVLGSPASDVPGADLEPHGTLARALQQLVPADMRAAWGPWIRRVLADLRRAFACPREERTEAWGRWLFLIPYSVPAPSVQSEARASATARSAGVNRPSREGAERPEHQRGDSRVLDRPEDLPDRLGPVAEPINRPLSQHRPRQQDPGDAVNPFPTFPGSVVLNGGDDSAPESSPRRSRIRL
jgi:hypothetical protein